MTGRHNGAEPEPNGAFDPFTVPPATHHVADAALRSRVVIEGSVQAVDPVAWAGGPVLEVAFGDLTDTITLVFLGRHTVGGVELGQQVTAAGTVGSHRGRKVILNPTIWLTPTRDSGIRQPELASSN